MSAAGFAALRDHVVAEPELAARLASIDDAADLFTAVLELAAVSDVDVSEADLVEAIAAGKRRVIERWL
jgi:hypothetical protein